ncbi:uncharacterized protein LOC143276448 [Babylonia areolata]|uniref:uncharacterized protein LOC143276448 n=1 Tax=Babylonia areolata TaxID=304850 RepID=UPI003FCFD50E
MASLDPQELMKVKVELSDREDVKPQLMKQNQHSGMTHDLCEKSVGAASQASESDPRSPSDADPLSESNPLTVIKTEPVNDYPATSQTPDQNPSVDTREGKGDIRCGSSICAVLTEVPEEEEASSGNSVNSDCTETNLWPGRQAETDLDSPTVSVRGNSSSDRIKTEPDTGSDMEIETGATTISSDLRTESVAPNSGIIKAELDITGNSSDVQTVMVADNSSYMQSDTLTEVVMIAPQDDVRSQSISCRDDDRNRPEDDKEVLLPTQTTDEMRQHSRNLQEDFIIKLELPWSLKEEPLVSPVSGTSQSELDNAPGSPLPRNGSHVCQHCSAAFVLHSSLELHVASFHSLPVFFSSDQGNQGTKKLDNPGRKRAGKGRKDRVKDTCSDKAEGKKGKKRHVCDVCSKDFLKASHLRTHMMIHTGQKPFVCDVCHKGFTEAGSLKRHKRIHTKEKPYSCSQCHASFNTSCTLQKHIRTVHIGDKPYVCDICGAAFSGAGNFKIHKRVHTGEKPYSCDVCEAAFSVSGALKKHKRIHTGEKPYTCNVCGVAFSRTGTLNTHKKIHTGEKPFICDICGVAFPESAPLRIHKRIHTGEKPYTCDVCGTAFCRADGLKRHKRTHTGEKPYTCDVCGVAFSATEHLKRHKKIHTGEKPYMCANCGKGFARSVHLKIHCLTHTGEKPHTCPHCPVAFTQSYSLKKHLHSCHV